MKNLQLFTSHYNFTVTDTRGMKNKDTQALVQSTLAKSIQKVLGPYVEVTILNVARKRLMLCPTAENKNSHKTALARAQTKVHVKRTCTEPWGEELKKNPDVHSKHKSLKVASQLLKHWNITVRL